MSERIRGERGVGEPLEAIEVVRARVPVLADEWRAALEPLNRDLSRIEGGRLQATIVVIDDEVVFPEPPEELRGQPFASWIVTSDGPLERRPLLVPQIWLELAGSRHGLGDPPDSVAEATVWLAGDLQDLVTDEIWRAWLECPVHGHPLEASLQAGTALWVCPRDDSVSWPIGGAPAT